MEEKALQEYEHGALVNIEDYAMSADALVKQVGLIQDVMGKVMKIDEHYGTIPGTKKPSLFKPGAEKLCLLFRLNPDYEIIMKDREDFFISYTVKCTLAHIPTGQVIASGVGACNSKETKYRWRYLEESTGQALPKSYWTARDSGDSKEMKRLLGGDGFRAAKIDGAWVIAKSEQVENDNPYDLDNTLMKMACKRALVAATLNATAASDIFTQDTEDLPAEILGAGGNGGAKAPPTVTRKSDKAPESTGSGKTPHQALKDELDAYVGTVTDSKADVLKAISGFTNDKGEEIYMRAIPSKGSDKWVGSSLGKLRKMAQAGTGEAQAPVTPEGWKDPTGCQHKPTECDHSGWIDGKPYCGPDGPACPYHIEAEG